MDVSVIVCTYNRANMLRNALSSICAAVTGGLEVEIIAIDNNSTDGTRDLVKTFETADRRVRGLLETRQGLSYARNTGVAAAQASLIIFTDDDVLVAPDWIAALHRTVVAHPEVAYVGGRVLPSWSSAPPIWLDEKHWAPLALQDMGNSIQYVNRANPRALIGANLAVRSTVFARGFLFQPAFQRVCDGIGSTEDHEFQLQLWNAGLQGLYEPAAVVYADVQPERHSKDYHRRWHSSAGMFHSRMRLLDVSAITCFGVPGYLYNQWLTVLGTYARTRISTNLSDRLAAEFRLLYLSSYIRTRWSDTRAEEGTSVTDIIRFAAAHVARSLSLRRR